MCARRIHLKRLHPSAMTASQLARSVTALHSLAACPSVPAHPRPAAGSAAPPSSSLVSPGFTQASAMAAALLCLCLGFSVVGAQSAMGPGSNTSAPVAQPAADPPVSLPPTVAPNCYKGNGTDCYYSFYQCEADADCAPLLTDALAMLGLTELPLTDTVACYQHSCSLITPSTPCLDIGFPPCTGAALAPVAGPGSGQGSVSLSMPPPTAAPAPSPALPGMSVPLSGRSSLQPPPAPPPPVGVAYSARCSADVDVDSGTGAGCCIEFDGSCETTGDCLGPVSAYLLTAPDPRPVPSNVSGSQCYAGQCYYADLREACSTLGKPLSSCTDGNNCIFSAANLTYDASSPDVHTTPTPTAEASAPMPAPSLPMSSPSPAPPSAGARSAVWSPFVAVAAVAAALAVVISGG